MVHRSLEFFLKHYCLSFEGISNNISHFRVLIMQVNFCANLHVVKSCQMYYSVWLKLHWIAFGLPESYPQFFANSLGALECQPRENNASMTTILRKKG